MFIGFYDYTVVLTYMSLLSSIVGMTEALDGRFGNAIACLVVSGICDMLDGKVARTKKDRTEDQKNFGIQIDSLCDLFCFGAFPAFLTYALGVRGIVGTISMCVYVLAAVIRLGYFIIPFTFFSLWAVKDKNVFFKLIIMYVLLFIGQGIEAEGIPFLASIDGWLISFAFVLAGLLVMLDITRTCLKAKCLLDIPIDTSN